MQLYVGEKLRLFMFVSERVLHVCGSHLHPKETGRVLHDGCLCPDPADCGSLLAFLLDRSECHQTVLEVSIALVFATCLEFALFL